VYYYAYDADDGDADEERSQTQEAQLEDFLLGHIVVVVQIFAAWIVENRVEVVQHFPNLQFNNLLFTIGLFFV
jgi:E3 ubiquitin-protein ligase DOA10